MLFPRYTYKLQSVVIFYLLDMRNKNNFIFKGINNSEIYIYSLRFISLNAFTIVCSIIIQLFNISNGTVIWFNACYFSTQVPQNKSMSTRKNTCVLGLMWIFLIYIIHISGALKVISKCRSRYI